MNLVFLDTETTGLDPNRHEIWEIAWAINDGPIWASRMNHSLRHADPTALMMNGYLDRSDGTDVNAFCVEAEIAVREAVTGATLVCSNPAFDAAFLRARWGDTPWHYRLWDISAFAAGVLDGIELMGLANIAKELDRRGFDIPTPDHSAAGDVATLRASFRALQKIQQDNRKASA